MPAIPETGWFKLADRAWLYAFEVRKPGGPSFVRFKVETSNFVRWDEPAYYYDTPLSLADQALLLERLGPEITIKILQRLG